MTSRNKTKPTITVEAGVHPAPDTERRLRRLAALLLGEPPPDTNRKPEAATSGGDKNNSPAKGNSDVGYILPQ